MSSKTYPKILVISHNVLSDSSNMGRTISDFFTGWDKFKIAQLYFHSEVPTSNICENYFRITDVDMIHSIFKFKKPGMILDKAKIDSNRVSARTDMGAQASFYQIGARRKPYVYLLRNLLWSTRKWKTKQLTSWISEYNPKVIFYAAGDYTFSMKIALDACQEQNIPMVVYFGDDFYFLTTASRLPLFEQLNRKKFRRQFEKLFSYLSTFTTATDKLNEKYSDYFKKKGCTIMNATIIQAEHLKTWNNKIKISYIGNLGLNRWKALVDIGRCLKEHGLVLDIYSMEKDQEILSQLTLANGLHFQGGISPNKVKDTIKESTIIIHVEAMDEINKQLTKYSLSTKIGDSLGSGVCLFVYGPIDIASIEYLAENNAACICTEKKELKEKLEKILIDEELRQHYARNALELASNRHDLTTNANLFYEMICDVVQE